jgi:hypothetical protein
LGFKGQSPFVFSEWRQLRNGEYHLKKCIEANETYYPSEIPVDEINFTHDGTKIILGDLKKKRTAALSTFLKRRLARRFSIIGDQYHFSVRVDGNDVTAGDRNYLPKAQLLWIYPSESDNSFSAESLLSQCSESLKTHFLRGTGLEINGAQAQVFGWIATAAEPSKLQDDEESINRITVMVRGKMAKEDILPSIHSTAIYTKYVFGEIHADFLDSDDMEDITTSSRQDFFVDDDRYQALLEYINSELGFIRTKWEEIRSNAGVEEACKYEVVKGWYDNLTRPSGPTARSTRETCTPTRGRSARRS